MKFNFETDYIYIFHNDSIIKDNEMYSVDFNTNLFWKVNEVEEDDAYHLGHYEKWKDIKSLLDETLIILK